MSLFWLCFLFASTPASAPASLPVPFDSGSFNLLEGTRVGSSGLAVRPGIEIFGQYALRFDAPDGQWFHRFDLSRGHASLEASYAGVRARFVLEAVRSASEGALIGVATDSLVFRVREGFVGYSHAFGDYGVLDARAGVVPTLSVPVLESAWGLRAVAPTMLEATGLVSPADLGATVRYYFPRGFGSLAVGAFNGEGYQSRELNRGKNLEAALDVHPFAAWSVAQPLSLFVSYTPGSIGTASARADRLNAALLWNGRVFGAGVQGTYGWGVGDRSLQQTWLLDAFARATLFDRLLLGLRFSRWQRDIAQPRDHLTTLLATVGVRIVSPLEIFVALTRSFPGQDVATSLPGQDYWEGRLVARAVF